MTNKNTLFLAAFGCAFATAAAASPYDNSANYNNPIGMTSAQENQTVNSSLRDANGNLTVVNGQITSSSFSEVNGVQNFSGGVGNPAGTLNGTATAIGNQLNVVTAGSNNIVIVSSTQTNNGDQTANTNLNGN
jgi:holdfast attachment protein HfaA